MYRNKRIIILAHCILNQNAVVRDWERAAGGFNEIIRIILAQHISILQLPCPEFTFSGEAREPRSKAEYDTVAFRKHAGTLSLSIVEQLAEYHKNGYQLLGIVGISESPSCDTLFEKGVFMEEFFAQLQAREIALEPFDIAADYGQDKCENTEDRFKTWLAARIDCEQF
ncbi:hypothetical protein GH810_05900 [Acetobacterium paludosum]|uniref:DUF523 domain-containing protein n=1 Tax=Acetobacterium paludosum TaxID=52693 RepID=A0A923KP70_9FIRM|nr:CD3072 family TudS-related putative desulfidase [Acetobacterium paludosum]MBC3887839.1 hypothetical protein [Acetobacterium paludosum]